LGGAGTAAHSSPDEHVREAALGAATRGFQTRSTWTRATAYAAVATDTRDERAQAVMSEIDDINAAVTPLLARLADAHADYNRQHFADALQRIPVRLSSRMKTRLGHYSPAGEDGPGAEIVLSRRHLRRDGWPEALHTLLHEMIHQWQDESGHPLDHGPSFRRKAREVGVLPRAKRPVG
jgi:hypothetical protein